MFTSVLEAIRAARDNKAATLEPDVGTDLEVHRADTDVCRDALLSMVAGESPSPSKKARAGRSRDTRENRRAEHARSLSSLGSMMSMVVPACRGSEDTATLHVVHEKAAQVTLEVTSESLTWLHQWVQAEVKESTGNHRPTRAHGELQCVTNSICGSQRRRCWLVS